MSSDDPDHFLNCSGASHRKNTSSPGEWAGARAWKVSIHRRVRADGLSPRLIRGAARQVLRDTGTPPCEVSVLLTDDSEIRRLNRAWRAVDHATDVLSFPLSDPADSVHIADKLLPPLGDVVISVDTARREATLRCVTFDDVVAHLTVHGVLHLLGYDHTEPADERDMRARERTSLERLGRSPVMWDGPRE